MNEENFVGYTYVIEPEKVVYYKPSIFNRAWYWFLGDGEAAIEIFSSRPLLFIIGTMLWYLLWVKIRMMVG